MRPHFSLAVLTVAVALGVLLACQKPPPEAAHYPFTKLSGNELMKLLLETETRSRAFYELWRRGRPAYESDEKDEGFDAFENGHHNPTIVVCPQEKGAPPIYIVLSNVLGRSDSSDYGKYPITNPSELFRSAPTLLRELDDAPLIEVFTADGRRIDLFDGNNVLDGALADINADGTIERVEETSFSVDGVDEVQCLTVSTVKAKLQPLFAVILNWGAREWTFRLMDSDGDHVSEIEIGPLTASGFKPKAVWKWDRAKHKYVGPAGNDGDHFRVINATQIREEHLRFQTTKMTFPTDPEAVSEMDDERDEVAPATPVVGNGEPYLYRSLKGASDAELFRFMGRGRDYFDRYHEKTVKNSLPDGFWTMDAKQATLGLINANRTDKHRAKYQVALDDRDKAEPPARCTITFSESSSRCYNAVDYHYFLRVDPGESYLAYARSWAGGAVFYNIVHDQPAFDLRLCPLPYEDAHKIASVVWSLDRIRTRGFETFTYSISSSTADGSAKLTVRVDAQPLIERSATIWSDYLSERWNADYDHEAYLNFSSYLITDALPAHLGDAWSQFEPQHPQQILARQESAPIYSDAERKRLEDLCERFLDWFALDQDKISFAIVAQAAKLAAGFSLDSMADRLRAIESRLPPAGPKKRSYGEVSAELKKLPEFELTGLLDPKEESNEISQQRAALEKELDAIIQDMGADTIESLRARTSQSLRQLAAMNDGEALYSWAILKSESAKWALQRLAQVDRKRYADAIESLMSQDDGKWARQYFTELVRTAPERAAAIARDLPPDKPDALTVSAFLLLREAGDVPDEAKRVATMMRIMLDPKNGWEERARAIESLVPVDAPLRYPSPEVDDALLQLFEPGQADELLNFSLDRACRALARRNRTDLFDRIAQQLQATEDSHIYHGILGALTQLAQADPTRLNPRLVAIVKPHLTDTNSMSAILWAIWSADLRELLPDLERLATRDDSEYEDRKASSYGGKASAVTGRFHLARKFASVWREPDALTRARLLIVMSAMEAHEIFGDEMQPERLARMKTEMNRTSIDLSPEAKVELAALLSRIDSNEVGHDLKEIGKAKIREVTAFARRELRL